MKITSDYGLRLIVSGAIQAHRLADELAQLEQADQRLEELETVLQSRRQLVPVAIAGFVGLAIGLFLLAGILIAMFGG